MPTNGCRRFIVQVDQDAGRTTSNRSVGRCTTWSDRCRRSSPSRSSR